MVRSHIVHRDLGYDVMGLMGGFVRNILNLLVGLCKKLVIRFLLVYCSLSSLVFWPLGRFSPVYKALYKVKITIRTSVLQAFSQLSAR